MFSTAGNKSSLERRLKDLEKEAKLVQGDIKALSRALKKPEELAAVPRLKSVAQEFVKPPSRRDPILSRLRPEPSEEPPEPPEPEEPAQQPAEEDLFSWAPRNVGRPEFPETGREADIQGPQPRQAVSGDKRFANYFTSGTFITPRPLRTEKNVQRNRAIAMIILLILVGLWVFSLWFWR